MESEEYKIKLNLLFDTEGVFGVIWGDLVVPTGWRQWGRSMDFLSFCRISFKGFFTRSQVSIFHCVLVV